MMDIDTRRASVLLLGVDPAPLDPTSNSGQEWEASDVSSSKILAGPGVKEGLNSIIIKLRTERAMRLALHSVMAEVSNGGTLEESIIACLRGLNIDASTQPRKALNGTTGDVIKFAIETTILRPGTPGAPHARALERSLGLPGHDVEECIRLEHCERECSLRPFEQNLFGVSSTTPYDEWEFVASPVEGKRYAGDNMRRAALVDSLLADDRAAVANLTRAEVIAVRLATGPMLGVYNKIISSSMGDGGLDPREAHHVTTIHTIVSAISKLSKNCPGLIFVGLESLTLPLEMCLQDCSGARRGCEALGFISGTSEMGEAALPGGERPGHDLMPLALKMKLGNMAQGASIGWLSQKPCKGSEVMLPPMTYLELDGDTRLDLTQEGAEILVVPVSVWTPPIDRDVHDLAALRKELHLSAMSHIFNETRSAFFETERSLKGRDAEVMRKARILEEILKECDRLITSVSAEDSVWYEDDDNLMEAMRAAINYKRLALLKYSIALEHVQRGSEEGVLDNLKAMPIDDLDEIAGVRMLRSGVWDFPWSKVCDRIQEEVSMPHDLEVWQASMLWDCLLDVQDTVKRVKFSNVIFMDWSKPFLKLANQKIGVNGAKIIAGLLDNVKTLTSVILPGNDIGEEGAVALGRALAGISCLTVLDLSDNQISGREAMKVLIEAVESNPRLAMLDIRGNNFTFADGMALYDTLQTFSYIEEVCGLPLRQLTAGSITELDLHDKKPGPVEAALAIVNLKSYDKITYLNLAGARMGSQGTAQVINLLENNPSLTTLDLRNNELTYKDGLLLVPALKITKCPLRSLSGLPLGRLVKGDMVEFSLRSMQCGPAEGAIAISYLPLNTQLCKFSLFGVGVGEEGMRDLLPHLQAMTRLELLDLRENGLKKEHAKDMYAAVIHLPLLKAFSGLPFQGLLQGTVKRMVLKDLSIGEAEGFILLQLLRQNKSLAYMDVRGASINNDGLPELLAFVGGNAELKHLDLRENDLSLESGRAVKDIMLPSLEFISGVPARSMRINEVKKVDVSKMDIGVFGGSIAVGMLQYSSSITSLNLASVHLGAWAMPELLQFLKTSQALKELDVRDNELLLQDGFDLLNALGEKRSNIISLSGIPLAGMLSNNVTLLELKQSQIGPAEIAVIGEALKASRSVTKLDMSDNGFMGSDSNHYLIEAFRASKQLSDIDLRGNDFTAKEGAELMDALERGKRLDRFCGIAVSELRSRTLLEVDLYYKKIGPMEGVALGQLLRGMDFIETLDLTRNHLGPDGVAALAPCLQDLVCLKELGLGCNGIRDEGAIALSAGLVHLTSLERLYAYENDLGPKGCSAIAKSLHEMCKLKQLYLSYNRMGDAGCSALCEALPHLVQLECLGLQNNGVGVAGWTAFSMALLNLKSIHYVNLQGNDLEAEENIAVAKTMRANMQYIAKTNGSKEGGMLYM